MQPIAGIILSMILDEKRRDDENIRLEHIGMKLECSELSASNYDKPYPEHYVEWFVV